MTDEQIEQWKVERDIARRSEKSDLIQAAYDHRDEMMMTCIAHQSSRQKTLIADVAALKEDVKPLKADHAELIAGKERRKGFMMAIKLAKYLVASGLGAALMKFLGGAA